MNGARVCQYWHWQVPSLLSRLLSFSSIFWWQLIYTILHRLLQSSCSTLEAEVSRIVYFMHPHILTYIPVVCPLQVNIHIAFVQHARDHYLLSVCTVQPEAYSEPPAAYTRTPSVASDIAGSQYSEFRTSFFRVLGSLYLRLAIRSSLASCLTLIFTGKTVSVNTIELTPAFHRNDTKWAISAQLK